MTKSGRFLKEKKSKFQKSPKTCLFCELNDSESILRFFQKIFFGSFKILKKPRRAYFMNRWSSVAEILRVDSPQVSLSISKKSFCSEKYFLSYGSFNMAKKRKNRVNRGRSGLIISWTGILQDMRFSQALRGRLVLSISAIKNGGLRTKNFTKNKKTAKKYTFRSLLNDPDFFWEIRLCNFSSFIIV